MGGTEPPESGILDPRKIPRSGGAIPPTYNLLMGVLPLRGAAPPAEPRPATPRSGGASPPEPHPPNGAVCR